LSIFTPFLKIVEFNSSRYATQLAALYIDMSRINAVKRVKRVFA
jgi:hypothetical protein